MRPACTLLVLLSALSATAKPLSSYDVPGLVLVADAIVVAERLGPGDAGLPGCGDCAGRYRVTQAVRGEVPLGAVLDLYDHLYMTEWPAGSTRAVLFLERGGELRDRWMLISSGLRQERDGQVLRFEQHSNPGGYRAEPDRRDGKPVTIEGLLAEVREVVARLPRLEALSHEPDVAKRRAAARALLPAHPDVDGLPFFFEDPWARRVVAALSEAGDLEGALALMPFDRTHGAMSPQPNATLEQLFAFAEARAQAPELRAQALTAALDHHGLFAVSGVPQRLGPLLNDEAPRVRAAAARVLERTLQWSSSDPRENAQLKVQAAASKKLLAARLAVEEDPRVLLAVAEPWAGRASPPRKAALPLGVDVRVEGSQVKVWVLCLGRFQVGEVRLLAGDRELPVQSRYVRCGGESWSGGSEEPRPVLPAGVYPLRLEGHPKGKVASWPVGTLTVADDGAWSVE